MRKHFLNLKNCTLRVQTLITRTALFLPAYAVLLWISLAIPAIFGIMEGPISICEGLSFYGFFATIVANLGGPDKTIQAMITQNKKPISCCPSDHVKFYNSVRRGLFQFLAIRPITVTVAQLFSYNNIPALYAVFNAVSMVQFLWGFCSIIFFCKCLFMVIIERCTYYICVIYLCLPLLHNSSVIVPPFYRHVFSDALLAVIICRRKCVPNRAQCEWCLQALVAEDVCGRHRCAESAARHPLFFRHTQHQGKRRVLGPGAIRASSL
jgi:hypothetical protein